MGGWLSALGGLAGGIASGYSSEKGRIEREKKDAKLKEEMTEMRKAVDRRIPATPEQTPATGEKKPVSDTTNRAPRNPPAARGGVTIPGPIVAAHDGGRIEKTGVYRMKKGELVIPAKLARRVIKRYTGGR